MESNIPTSTDQFYTRLIEPRELTGPDISAWKELEANSLEPNAFLSPNFVIPAIRYLEKDSKPYLLLVYKKGASELVGVFAFKYNKFSYFFPFPHISAFHSRHSFLTNILADERHVLEVVKIVFEYILTSFPYSNGIVFEEHPLQGALADVEKDITSKLRLTWIPFTEWDRSLLYPSRLEGDGTGHLGKRLLKNFRHYMRGLSSQGDVDWAMIRGDGVNSATVDDFIRLEHMGWKGRAGTSLQSRKNHQMFFREMVQNFSLDGRALFTELRLDKRVIASTSNLVSGKTAFAFKVGWDEAYAKYSPGTLNEIMLLKCQDTSFKEIECFDSGTTGDSYINQIWPERVKMGTGVYVKPTGNGNLIAKFLISVWFPILLLGKKIKSRLRGH